MNRTVMWLLVVAVFLALVVIAVLALGQGPIHNPTAANPFASKPTTSGAEGNPL